MTTEELLKAIGEIDEDIIAEAAEQEKGTWDSYRARRRKRRRGSILAGLAAAAVAVVILLPNLSMSVAYAWEKIPVLSSIVKVVVWRDYQVEEGRHEANVVVPRVEVEAGNDDGALREQLQQSAEEVNASVEELTETIITEFEAGLAEDEDLEGADSVTVGHEVLTDDERYFSMKLWVVEAMGSGWETDYYYTIDRRSGKILTLADLFEDESYIETISEEIKRQMRQEMEEDENVVYWLDDPEVGEWNFERISGDQGFYISSSGELVICFDEGDVAPMYMGCVSFDMPAEIWQEK